MTRLRQRQLTLDQMAGWMSADETWSYASPTSINVPSGAASKYVFGDRLKLTSNGVVLYVYVIGIADTVLTVIGNTLTNYPFSENYFSHNDRVVGFPKNFPYTCTRNGYTTSTFTAYFSISGGFLNIVMNMQGTSNSNVNNVSLPFNVSPPAGASYFARGLDNTTWIGPVLAELSGNSILLCKGMDGIQTTWTTSGVKGVVLEISIMLS